MFDNVNIDEAIRIINNINWRMTDPRMDGFSTWGYKQDLYRIQWALEKVMAEAPTYANEADWLEEQRVEKAINILSNNP